MTFRLPFQISRVGGLCRPINPNGLVYKLAAGKRKRYISYQIKKNPFANLLQECKHVTSYIPIRYTNTKVNCEYFTEENLDESIKTAGPKLLVKKCETNNYCENVDEINFGPYFNEGPTQVKSKNIISTTCNPKMHTNLTKFNYGMESYYNEIKDINDQMNTTPKFKLDNNLTDINLKIQNNFWNKSSSGISNVNCKNNIWKFIYGKQKTLKHNLWQHILSTKKKLIQAPTSTKTSVKAQQRLVYITKIPKISKGLKIEVEEKNAAENFNDTQSSATPDILKIKNCKYIISDSLLKLNASKVFEQHQIKSSKFIQSNTSMKVKKGFKQNVIMATVYNRQLSSKFMKQYDNHNTFCHMNGMKDLENNKHLEYPKICYNAENDSYFLYDKLRTENVIPDKSKSSVKKTVSIQPTTSGKINKLINSKKIGAKTIQKIKQSLKATNEASIKQSTTKSILEKLNETIENKKLNLAKIEIPLSKKKDQKVKKKIKSTKIPKTLGEIYEVGKVSFIVEVLQPGQPKHKQYLVLIESPESEESSENDTNNSLPLNINNMFNRDLFNETFISKHVNLSKYCKAKTMPEQTITSKTYVPEEINDSKEFEPLLLTKLSQLIQIKMNIKENDAEWTEKTCSQHKLKEQETSKNMDNQPKVSVSFNNPDNRNEQYKKMWLQKITNTTNYVKNRRELKPTVNCKYVRQYSTLNRRYQRTKKLNKNVHPTIHIIKFQQTRNLCCNVCPYCGRCPCVCYNPCSPCGWQPSNNTIPQCTPRFRLDYCCPRQRWNCDIPIPPCQKIEAPYPSYGECRPTWWKEPTECFDYEQHKLQPKNQVSKRILLMEESMPKVTVVDPSLERKCWRDKCCEPYYPPTTNMQICYDCPHKIPVDCCPPRGRPHCFCWPDRQCTRKSPPYRCFSDEELEFPEVPITECDLASKFANDLYRRMGKKCPIPFTPYSTVKCDLRTGEPRPARRQDTKEVTCIPPGTYLAPTSPCPTPPCQNPDFNTCTNCCMPTEGIKKTRCTKRCCPQDRFGLCPPQPPGCCPPDCCPAQECPDIKPKDK